MSLPRFAAALVVALALGLVTSRPAVAQQSPDLGQMSGTPLPTAEMPDGTVSVRVVRDTLANNQAGVTVTLTGDGVSTSAETDADGRAIFSGMRPGVVVTARVRDAQGGAVASQPFPVPAQGGVRLILALGLGGRGDAGGTAGAPGSTAPATATPQASGGAAAAAVAGRVVLGAQTRTIVEVVDGGLEVFHVFEIANIADTPVDAGPPIEFVLPEGARAVTLLEGSTSQARVFERKLVIAGPFASGRTMAQVAYRLGYDGPRATIDVPLPLPMIQTNLIVRRLGDTRVVAPVLPQSREAQAEGRTYWTGTGPGLNAGDTLSIVLDGLPHHARWPRYTALAVAGAIILAGIWLAVARKVDPEARIAALEVRRRNLLDEVRRLDAESSADAGAARVVLLDELEGVYALLDAERSRASSAGREAAGRAS